MTMKQHIGRRPLLHDCLACTLRKKAIRGFLLGAGFISLLAVIFYGPYYSSNFLSAGEDFMLGILRSLPFRTQQSRSNTALSEKKAWPVCSLRWAAQEHVKSLNFSMPVLAWSRDLRPSVLGQLRSRSLPYGWKNVPRTTLLNTLQLLNDSRSAQLFDRGSLTCVRCAVVGNGGILNGSRQGKAIDSHHFVFRLNGAVIDGFEEDVGTKTSFYGFSTNSLKNSLSVYRRDGFKKAPQGQNIHYVFLPTQVRDFLMLAAAIKGVPVASGQDSGDNPSEYFGPKHNAKYFKFLHPKFVYYIKETFLNTTWQQYAADVYMPSTGALLLMVALHTCDQVSAYGFITENYKDFSDHYYDKIYYPLIFYANHDFEAEAKLWAELHAKKVLWLYTRPSRH